MRSPKLKAVARGGVVASRAVVWGLFALLLFSASGARAYSYAAAGAEPLIDARERALAGVRAGDFDAARVAAAQADDELAYLEQRFGEKLREPLASAVAARDADAIEQLYLHAFGLEVRRRLEAARVEIGDYQVAKGLVVRSKRFVDLIAPALEPGARRQAMEALERCLEAIGNPGVFGVGQRAPDPEVFAEQARRVVESVALP